jgi:hypothetical protein
MGIFVACMLCTVGGVSLGFVFSGKIGAAVASLEAKVETGLARIEAAIKAKL